MLGLDVWGACYGFGGVFPTFTSMKFLLEFKAPVF